MTMTIMTGKLRFPWADTIPKFRIRNGIRFGLESLVVEVQSHYNDIILYLSRYTVYYVAL